MPPLSEKQKEAVRQSNYRRAEATRKMNRERVWTPEMIQKRRDTQLSKQHARKLRQAAELDLGHGIYKIRVDQHGYVKVGVVDHPHYGTMCSVSLHRVILSERLGRIPTEEEHGHHVDENKVNNLPENIQLLLCSEHLSYHAKKRRHTPERKAAVSAQFKGKKLTEEHKAKLAARKQTAEERRKRGESVRATCAAKREAGTHLRGPDSEDLRQRKAEAAKKAWDLRRANGTNKFKPHSEETRRKLSEAASLRWARKRAGKDREDVQ